MRDAVLSLPEFRHRSARQIMKPVHAFKVAPSLPEPLEPLRRVAYNLRWTWDHNSIELFRRLDSDLWETTGHNPVRMLGSINQAQLEMAARDETFLAHLERTVEDLDSYLSSTSTWYQRTYGQLSGLEVAYFSAEFGLTECLSLFSKSPMRITTSRTFR